MILAIDLFYLRSVSASRLIQQLGIIDQKTHNAALNTVAEVLEILICGQEEIISK